ncbi:zinc dependent phospholipase C family protein [Hymenobacter sp. BT186]|uniref:Zinc dependent phospholipase C family protein n=1 Tax=Hymenobacter telluris TaxID=2816474 RepID=A0A939EYE8_9BACT|nr:zinc dependent phospholipase C family protein [Hymenobacter telluris]MBO0359462.1 zinc dependent phospholipase C family protein [Hymenobacter telluris]MBW3375488.1 zinc dependent phospholipase C family protein [Hymenobacter norwichensis]
MRIFFFWTGVVLVLTCTFPRAATAYSVLTHQAIIDSAWRRNLVPLLEKRYPGATREELIAAKSYAYGGSIIQDIGYYPFGSSLFSNLTHYVRSGDFVENILAQANNRNEYAFALGALSHYVADIRGHSEGTNRAMPSVYPELRKKFGDRITYEEAPVQHNQLEFAFDVVQLAAGRYRSDGYHDFIGFQVDKDLLERAFQQTYGLELGQIVFNVDLSVSAYRFSVMQLIPTASRAAWHANRHEIKKLDKRARRRDYVYQMSPQQYRKEFGTARFDKPGFGSKVMSKAVRILPKAGPLKPFAFKLPTPEAQKFFKQSFQQVLDDYGIILTKTRQSATGNPPPLPNYDFDTGLNTKLGEYALADETYGELVRKLHEKQFPGMTPTLQKSILSFFADSPPNQPIDQDEKKAVTIRQTQEALKELRAWEAPAVATP